MAEKQSGQLKSTKNFIRNFLHINNSREFLVFLLFLLISFLFWYLTTITNEYELKFSPTLKLKNVPKELMIIEPLPEKIDIVLKDKGDQLVKYKARGKFKELVIDYRQHANIMGRTAIYGAELNKLITSKLPSSTQLVSLSRDTLMYYVGSTQGVKVPVRTSGRIETNSHYHIDRIRIVPDSVTVYASATYLDTLQAVYTPEVDFTGLTDSLKHTLTLRAGMRGVKYEPAEVELNIAVSQYVEKSVEVPITGYLFPYGMSLKTFPSKAKITFRVSLEDYNKVSKEDFTLLVRYSQIQDNHTGKIAPQLETKPNYITNVKIEPEEVDYLLEINALPDLQ